MMTVCLIMGIALPLNGYAANTDVEIVEFKAGAYSQYTEKGKITAKIKNTTSSPLSNVKVEIAKGNIPGEIKLISNFTGDIAAGESIELTWEVDLTQLPMGQSNRIELSVKDAGGNNLATEKSTYVSVSPIDSADSGKPNLPMVPIDYSYKPDPNVNYNPQVKLEVISPSGGLTGGSVNNLQLKIKNTGNAPFNKVIAEIVLGEKMTLQNSSVQKDMGSMSRTGEATAAFPVFVDASHPGGNIPITFNVKGTDPTGKETTFSITEYVNVNAGSSLADRLNIINIQNPSAVAVDQNFNLKFSVQNNSARAAKNIKVTVEPTAPIVNRTKNIFVVDLAAGESKAFDVQMFAVGGAELQSQNYPIKITAETTGTDASSVVQYTGVFVDAGSSAKTVPQIIITNYTYGNSAVIANQAFPLSLVLKNTNTSQTLKNIKVSLTAEEGIFIPHNTSNSFYIDKIGPGGSINKTIELMTKPDAPEKTVSITVDMSYEDSKGNPVAVKDTISVPVVQERRLVIDDIVPTDVFFVGEAGNISVQYYNMGKNTLNNLVISAEGDFDFPQSTKMFVGKLDAGKNDFYDFQFIPLTAGESSGKVIFTFEDSSGKQIVIEKAFKIVAEEMVPIDPSEEIVEPQSSGILRYVIGGVVLVAVIGGALIYRKRRNKKINSLDIDSE